MDSQWYTGNAAENGNRRGWILGHFITPSDDVRATGELEVKWGVHPSGERRHEWVTHEKRSTMLLLVQGRFRLELSVGTVTLADAGDYVVWAPGIDHIWEAEEDSTVVTVRWPSVLT